MTIESIESLLRAPSDESLNLQSGTRLRWRAREIAPEAWRHAVHAPLSVGDVSDLERQVGVRMPADLSLFLTRYNGLRLFSGAITMYGLRRHYIRDAEGVLGQPFCIVSENTHERPRFLGHEDWVAGFYTLRGSARKVLIAEAQGGLALVGGRGNRLDRWDSIVEFMDASIARCIQESAPR